MKSNKSNKSNIRSMIKVLQDKNVRSLSDGGYIVKYRGKNIVVYPSNY